MDKLEIDLHSQFLDQHFRIPQEEADVKPSFVKVIRRSDGVVIRITETTCSINDCGDEECC